MTKSLVFSTQELTIFLRDFEGLPRVLDQLAEPEHQPEFDRPAFRS